MLHSKIRNILFLCFSLSILNATFSCANCVEIECSEKKLWINDYDQLFQNINSETFLILIQDPYGQNFLLYWINSIIQGKTQITELSDITPDDAIKLMNDQSVQLFLIGVINALSQENIEELSDITPEISRVLLIEPLVKDFFVGLFKSIIKDEEKLEALKETLETMVNSRSTMMSFGQNAVSKQNGKFYVTKQNKGLLADLWDLLTYAVYWIDGVMDSSGENLSATVY